MPSVSDTAYPRFKINPSAKELNEIYTPTVYELAFARERARQPMQRAGLLLLLKTFQRLAKIRQFAAEARSLDLTSLNDMPERKRLTLAGALILKQVARALDDVADMFIRQVKKMHHKAEEALMQYQVAHADRTDALIAVLREITLAYKAEGSREERLALIETLLEKDADQILAQCIAHEAVAGNKYLSFLPMFYSGRRGTLFFVSRKRLSGLDDARPRAS